MATEVAHFEDSTEQCTVHFSESWARDMFSASLGKSRQCTLHFFVWDFSEEYGVIVNKRKPIYTKFNSRIPC